jgi:hypothetical protein
MGSYCSPPNIVWRLLFIRPVECPGSPRSEGKMVDARMACFYDWSKSGPASGCQLPWTHGGRVNDAGRAPIAPVARLRTEAMMSTPDTQGACLISIRS